MRVTTITSETYTKRIAAGDHIVKITRSLSTNFGNLFDLTKDHREWLEKNCKGNVRLLPRVTMYDCIFHLSSLFELESDAILYSLTWS